MDSIIEFILAMLFVAFVILVFALLLALPTMWIVNYLFTESALVAVFGTPSLSFGKALALNLFFGIAFKSSSSSSKKG